MSGYSISMVMGLFKQIAAMDGKTYIIGDSDAEKNIASGILSRCDDKVKDLMQKYLDGEPISNPNKKLPEKNTERIVRWNKSFIPKEERKKVKYLESKYDDKGYPISCTHYNKKNQPIIEQSIICDGSGNCIEVKSHFLNLGFTEIEKYYEDGTWEKDRVYDNNGHWVAYNDKDAKNSVSIIYEENGNHLSISFGSELDEKIDEYASLYTRGTVKDNKIYLNFEGLQSEDTKPFVLNCIKKLQEKMGWNMEVIIAENAEMFKKLFE